MSDPNFEARRDLPKIANQIKPYLPPGWGLALFVFPTEEREGKINYISTAQRKDMLEMLSTWLQHHKANPKDFGTHVDG